MASDNSADTQISTADVQAPPPPPPPQVAPVAAAPQTVQNPLYSAGGPAPEGTEQASTTNERADGFGVEGENIIWEARYSLRNFLGRAILLALLVAAWIALAIYAWGGKPAADRAGWGVIAILAGIAIGLFALTLLRRVILARYGHYYRLTNRRLFVSTGLFNRRRDQMELLRVKDIYTRQTLGQRWLSLGTVVVVSTEQHFPMLYLTGVEDPKGVMDLIWHHARAERDERSAKVDAV